MPSTMSFAASLDVEGHATGLMAYVDASPTPFHAVGSAARMLQAAGFTGLDETAAFPSAPGRYYLVRGGSLVAWTSEADLPPATPYRVVGAHTDSPNLRIKPQPDLARAGWQLLGVEVYGGPLLNSWLDRDLALSGRVAVRDRDAPHGIGTRLLTGTSPILRVAQLAVHLDRTQNDGLTLNRQQHLTPLWGQGEVPGDFTGWLAEQVGVARRDVLGWDVMTHDTQPSARIGRGRGAGAGDLIAAPRLDNLATSYAAVRALVDCVGADVSHTPVVALFDHEEVGSQSERGAMSTLLPAVLERVVLARGGTREDYLRALAGTVVASGDMAHATHPNYPERHDPQHWVEVNGGPVLKVSAQLRYATDGVGAAAFALACEQAGVPLQRFVMRTDLTAGSTVGPMTSALIGASTVDVGAPMLSMHSCRELAGAGDPAMYAAALHAFLTPS